MKIVEGKSKFRSVVQIFIFRLLFYKFNNYDEFKKIVNKNKAIKSLVEQFVEKYSFEDPPFKLKFYCKKIFEDFYNDDNTNLPINFKLKNYEIDDMFPYDSNVINIKMIKNKEISNGSINCYENNSQFISRMAILIISNASEKLIGNKEFKEINEEINNLYKKKNKSINTLVNDAIFELTGNLHLNLIEELKVLLTENKYISKDNSIPEISEENFKSDNNEKEKYNERTLGIFLYSLKIALTIFIFDEKEKYFYSYLIMTENSSQKILDLLNDAIIPGFDLSEKGLVNQRKDKNYYDRYDVSISSLILRFILFSNLFFDKLTKILSDDDIKQYTLEDKNNNKEKYSCLQMLFYIWNLLEKKLIDEGVTVIEIFFNLINKYLPYILKKCTMETIKSRNDTRVFEDKFYKFIRACKNNYKEFSLNFIDTKMRYIIQEFNNPLKYDLDEFPFLRYYTVQSKPNKSQITDKIGNNEKYLILNKLGDLKCGQKLNVLSILIIV